MFLQIFWIDIIHGRIDVFEDIEVNKTSASE